MNKQLQSYQRGDIWIADLGQPLGHEQGLERPAVIVSATALANTANIHGLLIVVPGTSTPQLNPKTGQTRLTCVKIDPSRANTLKSPTYFMAEKLRALSLTRFRRCLGRLELSEVKALEDCLCLVMDLFK